jgi:uncharacterized membrane protein
MDDQRLAQTEAAIGRLLTIGTRASSAILAAGLVLALAAPSAPISSMLLAIGLVVLMGTPVARVGLSIAAFARGREWLLVTCTSIVFATLVAGILVALAS